MKQQELSAIMTTDFLNGKTEWGTAKMLGIKEGFVDFVQDDPLYISTVPAGIRTQMTELIDSIRDGSREIK